MHRLALRALLVALVLLAVLPAAASAKSYTIPNADITMKLNPDGSLAFDEQLTLAFSGQFTASYREIPAIPGGSIRDAAVSEAGRQFAPGGSTKIGGTGTPGTFGSETSGDGWTRIVWYHGAADETRTFNVTYTGTGMTTAWDDVVDVYVQVWGDGWQVGVDQLTAELQLPRAPTAAEQKLLRVWGMPGSVNGTSSLDGNALRLQASGVPASQFVELRATVPRSMLAAQAPAAQTRAGEGLQRIVTEQETDFGSSRFGASPASSQSPAPDGDMSATAILVLVGIAALWVAGLVAMGVTGGRKRVMWYLAGTAAVLVALFIFAARAAASSRSSSSGGGGSFGGGGGGGSGGGGGGSW